MRVGILIDRWDPARGGAEGALDGLVAYLVAAGHDVRVFAAEGADERAGLLRRVSLPRAWLLRPRAAREELLAARLTAAAEAERRVTVGVRHLRRVDLFWPHGGLHEASLAALARSRGRAPAATPRGRHRKFIALENALLAGGARRVVAVSELVARELVGACPQVAERLVVVEPGVDRERFHPRERAAARAALRTFAGARNDGALLVHAARRPGLKGLGVALDALERLERQSPERAHGWTLVVAGARDAARWRRAVFARGFGDRVAFVGGVAPEVLAAGADLALLPTFRDTYGLAVVEALSAGTPVLTTTAAGAAARVGVEAGAVVAPGDAAALADALGRWLDRLAAGEVDPERVRRASDGADERRGLERIEAELERLVRSG